MHNKEFLDMLLNELLGGRTFYENYFNNLPYKQLPRIDKVALMIMEYLGDNSLGEPKDFEKVKEKIRTIKEKENEHS